MKSVRILPVLMSLLLLAGCTMPSGDELLAAPKPPGNYQTLQTKLEELLASGVSYTTPTTGRTVRQYSSSIWTVTVRRRP